MNGLFRDRVDAGHVLAPKLRAFARRSDVIVVGVLTGGVAIAAEVARRLHVSLDVLAVRPLRVPGQEDLIFGAVGPRGVAVEDTPLITALGLSRAAVREVVQRERLAAARSEATWREHRPGAGFRDLTVVIIDEGIVTGRTMRAAIRTVAGDEPQAIVVAAPFATSAGVAVLRPEAGDIVTVVTSERALALGAYYRDFRPVTPADVHRLLAENRRTHSPVALPGLFRVPAV